MFKKLMLVFSVVFFSCPPVSEPEPAKPLPLTDVLYFYPSIDSAEILLGWKDPLSSLLDHLEIEITPEDQMVVVSPGEESYLFDGLTDGIDYEITIYAVDGGGKRTGGVTLSATPGTSGFDANHPTTGDFSPVDESNWDSATFPLGAHIVSGDLEVALYSKNASRVLLEIYNSSSGEAAQYDYWMAKGPDDIWRAKLSNVPVGTAYAFRLWGPNWPYFNTWDRGNSSIGFFQDVDKNGHRFNPNKVLFDPYARELSHDKSNPTVLDTHNNGMYGTGGADLGDGMLYDGEDRRNFDTGQWAPKAYVVADSTSTGTNPALHKKDQITYESHVRGLTKHVSSTELTTILSGVSGFESVVDVPDQYRGTYRGAAYMAEYLKALGINTIEFLPVHETDNDGNPDDGPGGNYWGYMTYGYFAPDRRYAYDQSPGGPTQEFKEMVEAFHNAGIEVYIDVVYNHSGEGGPWRIGDETVPEVAELTFFRGIDNAEYYALVPADKRYYWESTGVGNNLACDRPVVANLIKDSLDYWINEMGIDGFRFDLATVLGREYNSATRNWEFNPNSSLLQDIATMGTTNDVEMVAEAWDIGTYQVGNFPNGWGEWNGRFRDKIRRYIKSGGWNTDGDMGNYIYGDQSNFSDQGGPHKSVNFITAHDGFTLMDLVSFNFKENNLLWPFGPSDGGSDNNDSWNHIITGQTFLQTQSLRRQQMRNLITLQMLSRGAPMVLYGDEFARTQNGNNNPYSIDSVATWNNYYFINSDAPQDNANTNSVGYSNSFGTDTQLDGINSHFLFMKNLLDLRHASAALRQDDYSTVTYEYSSEDNWAYSAMIEISSGNLADGHFLLITNSYWGEIDYTIPDPGPGYEWVRIIETHSSEEVNGNYWDLASGTAVTTPTLYEMQPRSTTVWQKTTQ
jgi:isoamylase